MEEVMGERGKKRRGSGRGGESPQSFCITEHLRKQSTTEFLVFSIFGGFEAETKWREEAVSQPLQLSQQHAHVSLGFCHVWKTLGKYLT